MPPANTSPPAWDQIRRLHQLCAGRSDLLAHLYWPDRLPYFERSRDAHVRGGAWRLKATPGHGVGKPDRPTLNFLVASTEWVDAYAIAAERRDLRHGLLVRRAALTKLGPDYTLVDVTPRHPGGHADPRESWRHDVPNHRFAALDAMHRCTVVRLATPLADRARHVDIPAEEIVAWW